MRGDKLAENLQTTIPGRETGIRTVYFSLHGRHIGYEKKILGLTVASEFSSFCYGVSQVKPPVRPQWAPVHTETIHKEMILMGKARITFS
jgi:hypothetical protein